MSVGELVGESVDVGVGVSVGVFVGVSVGVLVGVFAEVTELVMILVLSVTAPTRAKARPSNRALGSKVMEPWAIMIPLKAEETPRVQSLPTCQKTLEAWAPLIRMTWLLVDVVMAVPTWKIKTAVGSPWASRVRVVDIPSALDI